MGINHVDFAKIRHNTEFTKLKLILLFLTRKDKMNSCMRRGFSILILLRGGMNIHNHHKEIISWYKTLSVYFHRVRCLTSCLAIHRFFVIPPPSPCWVYLSICNSLLSRRLGRSSEVYGYGLISDTIGNEMDKRSETLCWVKNNFAFTLLRMYIDQCINSNMKSCHLSGINAWRNSTL